MASEKVLHAKIKALKAELALAKKENRWLLCSYCGKLTQQWRKRVVLLK